MPLIKLVSDPLTEAIIAGAIAVHEEVGPGLLEGIYERCLAIELGARGLKVETERTLPLIYRGVLLDCEYRLDLIVDDKVIVEVKAVQALHPVFQAQVITYLRLTGISVGLLLNFNVPVMKQGIRRIEHPDEYKKKKGLPSPLLL